MAYSIITSTFSSGFATLLCFDFFFFFLFFLSVSAADSRRSTVSVVGDDGTGITVSKTDGKWICEYAAPSCFY